MTSDEFYIKQTIKTHNENNMLPPPIDEHEALNIISEIIVDGYIAEPIGSKQVYTVVICKLYNNRWFRIFRKAGLF